MILVTCVFLSLLLIGFGECSTLSIIRTSLWEHHVVSGVHPRAALVATFNNSYNLTGWSNLEIHGKQSQETTDEEMAYMAGYAEGVHTGELIYMAYTNTLKTLCDKPSSFCTRLKSFLEDNIKFMNDSIFNNPNSDYWRQVHLYLKQLEGLEKGYYSNSDLPPLPHYAFLYIQFQSDIEDLRDAFGYQEKGSSYVSHRVLGDGHCSALIKVLPNNEDLYTTHDTWTDYHTMLRVFKLYDLPYKSSDGTTIPGSTISFSSYPGKLQSEDDYYIMNSGLVTMETTNEIMDLSLYSSVTPQCLMEPIRVMIANRLANDGKQWSNTFELHNSGTYNNQWMIVNYNKFTPGQPLPSTDLLWVLEQIPGKVVFEDKTDVLLTKSYWASYNIPYYPEIFEMAGYPTAVEQHGNAFSHDKTPRALIFARNQSQVTDMDSLLALMRYNNFKHDPLSVCNCTPPYSAEYAIAARCDLNPAQGTYPLAMLGHRCHGATDNKVTNAEMVKKMSCLATSGPTHTQQPVFKWSTSGFDIPLGHPDAFDFSPVMIEWNNNTYL